MRTVVTLILCFHVGVTAAFARPPSHRLVRSVPASRIASSTASPPVGPSGDVEQRAYESEHLKLRKGVNAPLLALLAANQALIGVPAVALGGGAAIGAAHLDNPAVWLTGALSAFPLLALSNTVRASRDDAVVRANWSTKLFATKLLGGERQVLPAAATAALLGLIIGLVEETAFRGVLLPGVADGLVAAGLPSDGALALAVASTALVFGALHLSPRDLKVPGGDPVAAAAGTAEAALTLTTQTAAGLWLGLLATMPGGSLGLAVVAHAFFDAVALIAEHLDVTGQYAYAARMTRWDETHPHPPALLKIASSAAGRLWLRDVEFLFHFLDTDRSQTVGEHELRVGLHAYGLALSEDHFRHLWREVGVPGDPSSAELDLVHFACLVDALVSKAPFHQSEPETRGSHGLRSGEGVPGVKSKGLLGVRPM